MSKVKPHQPNTTAYADSDLYLQLDQWILMPPIDWIL